MDIHTSEQPMKTYNKALLYKKRHHSVIRKCESGGEEVGRCYLFINLSVFGGVGKIWGGGGGRGNWCQNIGIFHGDT